MAIVVLQHGEATGAGRLGRTLRDYGHRLRTVALHRGEPVPVDIDDVDGVIATGGTASALGGEPWLEPEMAFLRAADARALPIVGICLGCQVLARALGGEVAVNPAGTEAGWHDVSLTPPGTDDPVFAGFAWTSRQVHFHRECVSKPPPGARVLAKSQRTAVQAWARGLRTYAFQFHPVVDPAMIERMAAEDPKALAEAGTTLEALREATRRHYPACERLTQRLFESIALYLVPADRRMRGLVKDLHH
jgi:GMP synthase-like glutamine amidotransferase